MSEAGDTLRDTVAAWGLTRFEMARLATERGDDWRLATVRLRRKLQDQIGVIAAAMGGLDASLMAAAEFETLRRALSAVRSQLAMHQAQWPVVSIEPENADYKASAAALRRSNDALAQAAAQFLQHMKGRPQSGRS